MGTNTPFSVGVITDEVSQSLACAIEFCKGFGLSALELRSVDGVSPFDWTEEQVRAFQQRFDLQNTGTVAIVTWNAITSIYEDIYRNKNLEEGQYPGYPVGGDRT